MAHQRIKPVEGLQSDACVGFVGCVEGPLGLHEAAYTTREQVGVS